MEKISDRLLAAMRDADITYVELAKQTGISKSALQRYATGETEKIPLDRIELIARALNVSAAYLLGWENNPPVPFDEGVWEKICEDDVKILIMNWIANMDHEQPIQIIKILSAITGKEIPPSLLE